MEFLNVNNLNRQVRVQTLNDKNQQENQGEQLQEQKQQETSQEQFTERGEQLLNAMNYIATTGSGSTNRTILSPEQKQANKEASTANVLTVLKVAFPDIAEDDFKTAIEDESVKYSASGNIQSFVFDGKTYQINYITGKDAFGNSKLKNILVTNNQTKKRVSTLTVNYKNNVLYSVNTGERTVGVKGTHATVSVSSTPLNLSNEYPAIFEVLSNSGISIDNSSEVTNCKFSGEGDNKKLISFVFDGQTYTVNYEKGSIKNFIAVKDGKRTLLVTVDYKDGKLHSLDIMKYNDKGTKVTERDKKYFNTTSGSTSAAGGSEVTGGTAGATTTTEVIKPISEPEPDPNMIKTEYTQSSLKSALKVIINPNPQEGLGEYAAALAYETTLANAADIDNEKNANKAILLSTYSSGRVKSFKYNGTVYTIEYMSNQYDSEKNLKIRGISFKDSEGVKHTYQVNYRTKAPVAISSVNDIAKGQVTRYSTFNVKGTAAAGRLSTEQLIQEVKSLTIACVSTGIPSEDQIIEQYKTATGKDLTADDLADMRLNNREEFFKLTGWTMAKIAELDDVPNLEDFPARGTGEYTRYFKDAFNKLGGKVTEYYNGNATKFTLGDKNYRIRYNGNLKDADGYPSLLRLWINDAQGKEINSLGFNYGYDADGNKKPYLEKNHPDPTAILSFVFEYRTHTVIYQGKEIETPILKDEIEAEIAELAKTDPEAADALRHKKSVETYFKPFVYLNNQFVVRKDDKQ